MVITLINANEQTIYGLLKEDCRWSFLVEELITVALDRNRLAGMENHHVEPLRKEVISLWPLEHLAIHICEANLNPSDSTHAKVGSFVKPFPGNYRRVINVSEELKLQILSFGQRRPSRTSDVMKAIANLPQSKIAQAKVGSVSGKKTGPLTIVYAQNARRGAPCTWGDKISKAIESKGTFTCPRCGKVIKNIASNILQHQRSKKCKQNFPTCL